VVTAFRQGLKEVGLYRWPKHRDRIPLGARQNESAANPVILAEQAATLDLLSEGRLDFGVGKGYRYNEFRGFAIPLEEADARFEEALAIITKAWTSEQRFSHHDRFWTFNDILVEPPPCRSRKFNPAGFALSRYCKVQHNRRRGAPGVHPWGVDELANFKRPVRIGG
jgi:hypothetical protein